MFATHPKMAKKWAAHTPDQEDLPDKAEAADRPNVDMAQILGYTLPRDKELERKMPSLKDTIKIREDVNVKKLHEPGDFAEEAQHFIDEQDAQLAALQAMAEEQGFSSVLSAIDGCRKAANGLKAAVDEVSGQVQAQEEAEAKQAAATVTSPTTTFKKA